MKLREILKGKIMSALRSMKDMGMILFLLAAVIMPIKD